MNLNFRPIPRFFAITTITAITIFVLGVGIFYLYGVQQRHKAQLVHTASTVSVNRLSSTSTEPRTLGAATGPPESAAAINPTPAATTLRATKSTMNTNQEKACAAAMNAYSAAAYSGSYPTTQQATDDYNQSRTDAYNNWLKQKSQLGCTYSLTAPYVVTYYGAPASTPVQPIAPPAPKVCDLTQKSSIDTQYQQDLAQEDARFQQQVSSFISANGISGSAAQQASFAFMPQHQQNYTQLRTSYFSSLASINCNT